MISALVPGSILSLDADIVVVESAAYKANISDRARHVSGIDSRDIQSKEVSAHADFLGWIKTY